MDIGGQPPVPYGHQREYRWKRLNSYQLKENSYGKIIQWISVQALQPLIPGRILPGIMKLFPQTCMGNVSRSGQTIP